MKVRAPYSTWILYVTLVVMFFIPFFVFYNHNAIIKCGNETAKTKWLFAFVAVGQESPRTEIVRKNIEWIMSRRELLKETHDIDCLVFTFAPFKQLPDWIKRMYSNNNNSNDTLSCRTISVFGNRYVPFLKYLDPKFLIDSGYDYMTITLDDVIIHPPDSSFDPAAFFNFVETNDLCIASPSIKATGHTQLNPRELKQGVSGRYVTAIEVQSITFRLVDAWSCFYELIDTEYPSGWGIDIWFHEYCMATKRITRTSSDGYCLGVMDGQFVVHAAFPSSNTVDKSVEYVHGQENSWKELRNITLVNTWPAFIRDIPDS